MPDAAAVLTENRSRSLMQVNIGGHVYDAMNVPQCHTCQHPSRLAIERKILAGHSYRAVASQYSETIYESYGEEKRFPPITWVSIHRHFKARHLPVEVAALREIADERAREMSEVYTEETARIVDGHTFARQVLHTTQQRLIGGEIQPEVRDGLAAAKLLQDMEVDGADGIDSEVWGAAMTRYFELAQKIMPGDLWERFTRALTVDPVLQSIQRRLDQATTVEAEVVEEAL